MKLILLGTGGYHPTDDRQTACLMIPELGVILDAGTALYRARNYLCTSELDIFLTHAHLDHAIGITHLIDVVRDKNVQRTTVHAMPDKLAAIEEHLLAPLLFPVRPPCDLRALAAEEPLAGGGRLTHFPLEHPGGSIGFRLDWPGRSMAYVTDTTAADDSPYLDAIRGVDLLVHECYFPDTQLESRQTDRPQRDIGRGAARPTFRHRPPDSRAPRSAGRRTRSARPRSRPGDFS